MTRSEADDDTPAPLPIELGDLRRLQPIDGDFGGGRGRPVDRYYIENFLLRHSADIRGCVLEVGDPAYTHRFGGDRVSVSEVLHRDNSNTQATIVADLADGAGLPDAHFDCFICTQTLQYLYEPVAALRTIHRILRPGGVLLLTAPGISQISPFDRDRWGEHWRFTPQSMSRLLRDAGFGGSEGRADAESGQSDRQDRSDSTDVQVTGPGNVLAAVAFLHGLACEDLRPEELAHADDRYPLVVTARAVRR